MSLTENKGASVAFPLEAQPAMGSVPLPPPKHHLSPSFLPLPDLEASVHFAYGSRSLVHLQMPRKPPAPLASALLLFVSLPTSTDQLDVRQGGLTQFEEENCARLVWVKGVYLPPPRLTVSGFLVLDTTFQLVA